ncbi:MAG: dethiobiotin synthase, partial [Caulobacteraceae bacterium]|nr:dethiobiotin synthase [Caulobacter sp.]
PAEAVKPLASGLPPVDDPAFADTDTGRLLAALGRPLTAQAVDACTPWRFAAPVAPDAAAAREGRSLRLVDLVAFHHGALARAAGAPLIVEGVGGVMSPATSDALNLDWIAALGCPVLLVAGSYVGAISHALTSLAVLSHRRIAVAAVIVSESEGSAASPAETAAAISTWSGRPVGWLPRARTVGTG